MAIYPGASSIKPPSWAQTFGSKVMNAPAPPLIAPESVRERLVDIMNNVFTLVVWLDWLKALPRGIELQIDTK